jgi:hypothetical protein
MGDLMLQAEAEEGREPIWPRCKPEWLIADDWDPWPVLSIKDNELHIIAIASARKGAFRRLIEGAATAGLSPVVVCPMGQIMPAIMAKWGWRETVVGEGWDSREEWRPA